MMAQPQALALRRGMLVAAALAATLAAHAVSSEGIGLTPAAPVLWAMLVGAGLIIGPRRRQYRERSVRASFCLLVLIQSALHTAMTALPWGFGLSVHHGAPLLTPGAVAAHLGAALLLALLVARLEAMIGRGRELATVVRRAFRPGPLRLGAPALAPPGPVAVVHLAEAGRPARPRGPPGT
jgi:hypothetical protein